MKAATLLFGLCMHERFISIHAAREGGDTVIIGTNVEYGISIHAAREGGDLLGDNDRLKACISIHAAREGGDCGNE